MENIQNYLNTMIFIIIAKGITVALLILLILKAGQQFSYIIITVQLGLLAIVIWAMYLIIAYDKLADKLKNEMAKAKPNLDTCPDYYIRTFDESDNILCHHTSTTADDRYTYTVNSKENEVNLTQLISSSANMDSLCDKSDNFQDYPWTEYKAKCNRL